MLALCNKCNLVTDIKYKVKKHPNEIEETYFECDQCHYHFTCFVTDNKVRKMHKKRDALKGVHYTVKRQEIRGGIHKRMGHLKHNLVSYGRADIGDN